MKPGKRSGARSSREGQARPRPTGQLVEFTRPAGTPARPLEDLLVEALEAWFARNGRAGGGSRTDHEAGAAGDSPVGKVSRTKTRRLIVSGCAQVQGRTERRPGFEVPSGARVGMYVDEALFFQEKQTHDIDFVMNQDRVLYEDQWILAVDKPAGLPVEATVVADRANLTQAVKDFLASRDGTPEAYAALHHRLDRETSGVILFSKSPDANPGLHQAFLERRVHKRYLALCALPEVPEGPGGSQGRGRVHGYAGKDRSGHGGSRSWGLGVFDGQGCARVENLLGRVSPKSQACRWGETADGQPALTEIALLKVLGPAVLVRAEPYTGRTHQIRVHCAGLGLSLAGDTLYGGPQALGRKGRSIPVGRVMLHAAELELDHPMTGAHLHIRAELPQDFQTCLALLGAEE